jgi:uncharacterized protein (DUF697 family)
MSRIQEARNCVLRYAFGSSGVCGIFKLIIPIPLIEVGVLTLVTKKMCDKITRIYGYNSLSGMATFFGVLIGAASGVKLATGILDVIPGLGAGANAIATFSLHVITGIILIAVCELLDDESINESDLANSTVDTISKVLGSVTDVIGDFVRGDYNGAIYNVKAHIKRYRCLGETG